tara:strand:- start:2525 stop:2809 length:285 start_codon:yes stop_codon:yes gene_type:complete
MFESWELSSKSVTSPHSLHHYSKTLTANMLGLSKKLKYEPFFLCFADFLLSRILLDSGKKQLKPSLLHSSYATMGISKSHRFMDRGMQNNGPLG